MKSFLAKSLIVILVIGGLYFLATGENVINFASQTYSQAKDTFGSVLGIGDVSNIDTPSPDDTDERPSVLSGLLENNSNSNNTDTPLPSDSPNQFSNSKNQEGEEGDENGNFITNFLDNLTDKSDIEDISLNTESETKTTTTSPTSTSTQNLNLPEFQIMCTPSAQVICTVNDCSQKSTDLRFLLINNSQDTVYQCTSRKCVPYPTIKESRKDHTIYETKSAGGFNLAKETGDEQNRFVQVSLNGLKTEITYGTCLQN